MSVTTKKIEAQRDSKLIQTNIESMKNLLKQADMKRKEICQQI